MYFQLNLTCPTTVDIIKINKNIATFIVIDTNNTMATTNNTTDNKHINNLNKTMVITMNVIHTNNTMASTNIINTNNTILPGRGC